MKRNKGKILAILLIALSLISIQINTYAHSGRTDSSGGHKDNKNKSGLGSYHYHCGGHPAHLHTNGVCPYSSSSLSNKSNTSTSSSSKSSSSKSSSTSSSSSKKATTTTAPTTIDVTKIQINENIQSLEIGQNKTLTVTITPNNATNKGVTWKSDSESIATINSLGKVTAKKVGTVNITATSSNGKTSTIKLNIKEDQKVENSIIANTITEKTNSDKINNAKVNNKINNTEADNQSSNSNLLGGVITLGLLGGGGYLGYRKLKR